MSALARAKTKRDRALAASDNHGKPSDPQSSRSQGDHSIVDPYAVFSSSTRPAAITCPRSSPDSSNSYSPYQPEFEEEDDRYLDPGVFEPHGVPGQSENICETEAGGEQEDKIDFVKQSEAAFLENLRCHGSYSDEGDNYHDRHSFYPGRYENENEGEFTMDSGVPSSRFFDFKANQTVSPVLLSKTIEAPDSSLKSEGFSFSKKNAARGTDYVAGPDSGDQTPASRIISSSPPCHQSRATEITTVVTVLSSPPIESTHRTSLKRSADNDATTIIKSESEAPGVPLYRLTRANKRRKPTGHPAPTLPLYNPVTKDEGEDLKTSVDLAGKDY